MKSCPLCKTEVESFELSCHSCGNVFSKAPAPQIQNAPPSKEELEENFRGWISRGKDCLEAGNLEEASNCLREAVKRSRVLDDPIEKEVQARRLLAEVLERLGKIPEAADQYRIIAQEANTPGLREHWLKKSQDLLASSHGSFDELFRKEEFRPLLEEELRYVPLYCSGCKRPFAEAEIFEFRRNPEGETVQCWCGITARPLAKEDGTHSRAMESGKVLSSGQRAKAIQFASSELADGKKQSTACTLALTLGWCGGHKFYLGETVAGWIYLFWFWTFVPLLLSLYEALLLSQMSLTSFNMTYNLDVILSEILPGEKGPLAKSDVFSLGPGEEQTEEVG